MKLTFCGWDDQNQTNKYICHVMISSKKNNKAGSGVERGVIRKGLLIGQHWSRGMKEVREELGQFLREECLILRAEQGQRFSGRSVLDVFKIWEGGWWGHEGGVVGGQSVRLGRTGHNSVTLWLLLWVRWEGMGAFVATEGQDPSGSCVGNRLQRGKHGSQETA